MDNKTLVVEHTLSFKKKERRIHRFSIDYEKDENNNSILIQEIEHDPLYGCESFYSDSEKLLIDVYTNSERRGFLLSSDTMTDSVISFHCPVENCKFLIEYVYSPADSMWEIYRLNEQVQSSPESQFSNTNGPIDNDLQTTNPQSSVIQSVNESNLIDETTSSAVISNCDFISPSRFIEKYYHSYDDFAFVPYKLRGNSRSCIKSNIIYMYLKHGNIGDDIMSSKTSFRKYFKSLFPDVSNKRIDFAWKKYDNNCFNRYSSIPRVCDLFNNNNNFSRYGIEWLETKVDTETSNDALDNTYLNSDANHENEVGEEDIIENDDDHGKKQKREPRSIEYYNANTYNGSEYPVNGSNFENLSVEDKLRSIQLQGEPHFLFFFTCIQCNYSLLKLGEKIIFLDGTFFYYSNFVSLVACTVNLDRKVVPLAFGIYEAENQTTWSSFLTLFKQSLNTNNLQNEEFTFLSDRQKGLINAVSSLFPLSSHLFCLFHLIQNLKKFRDNSYLLIKDMCLASSIDDYNALFARIDKKSSQEYIASLPKESYCVFANPSIRRYGFIASSPIESLNNILKEFRKSNIIDFIFSFYSYAVDKQQQFRLSLNDGGTMIPFYQSFYDSIKNAILNDVGTAMVKAKVINWNNDIKVGDIRYNNCVYHVSYLEQKCSSSF
ncbi:hypothetical protein WA158_006945 [Blastocystis sp. Blastoise]